MTDDKGQTVAEKIDAAIDPQQYIPTWPPNPVLEEGDEVFVQSDGIVGYLIRRVEGRSTHNRSYVNHVARVVQGGPIFSSDPLVKTAMILDAQPPKVSIEHLSHYVGDLVSVYRPLNLTVQQKADLVTLTVERYNGKIYGFGKIPLHWLGLQRYARIDTFPICSWTVAVPMRDLYGLDYGTPANEASPESMLDFDRDHPQFCREVIRLGILQDDQVKAKVGA